MHVFPQLRKLERKYAAEVAVVGVHSAKFLAERSTDNVRQAVLRYGLEHPVVNDRDFAIWQHYGVRAWPTFVFVDPEGRIIGRHEGEIPFEELDRLLGEMVRGFDARGLIDRRPLRLQLERDRLTSGVLSFPGKVLTDAASSRLFIADSNHHRVIVASLDGRVREVVGSGEPGLSDGPFADARFNDPQGLALMGDTLYVADTGNHAIREVDLARATVRTIAGTGRQARRFHEGGPGVTADLSSPWDLVAIGGALYIAMAGFHQLWRLDLARLQARPHAGSGIERIADGPLRRAHLAQPSGIATDGVALFFTDSETSAVRSADLRDDGAVRTIVGLDLFAFGDVDGVGDEVRLQHPMGVTCHGRALLVADTYNNKVKRIVPSARRAEAFLGSGQAGHEDGVGAGARFHEPGGLSVGGGRLYVADTNNHAIRVADLATGAVTTLAVTCA